MPFSSLDYAALSEDSYRDRKADPNAKVTLNGVDYRVLAVSSNKQNDYQGTIYQRLDTREIVVAHRGTEGKKGDILTDAEMVFNQTNAQSKDAIALTQKALDIAKAEGERSGKTPPVTVTGHSLGGALAEITAHKFHLHGETFNAYGAAGLKGVPAGGTDVINHVRATDVVSAASAHYGTVKVYANQDDIKAMKNAGYENNRSQFDIRDPLNVAIHRAGPAHSISTFVKDAPGGSIMSQANLDTAKQYDPMIDKFRADVTALRTGLTVTGHAVKEGAHAVEKKYEQVKEGAKEVGHKIEQGVKDVGHKIEQGAKDVGHRVEQGAKEVGHKIEQGAREVGNKLEQGAEKVKQGAQHLEHRMEEGARELEKGAQKAWKDLKGLFSYNDSPQAPTNLPLVSGNPRLASIVDALDRSNVPSHQIDNRAIAAAAVNPANTHVQSAAVSPNAMFFSNDPNIKSPTAQITPQTLDPTKLPSLNESSQRSVAMETTVQTQTAQATKPSTQELEQPQRQNTMRA